MKRSTLLAAIVVSSTFINAQKTTSAASNTTKDLSRPRLVVGIVIDQMRWDYLYRYYSIYKNGGFKRMLNEGYTCENTFIPYTPTVTAAGHTCVYTGSVPAVHGITGNNWYDRLLHKTVYCADDASVKTVGSNTNAGEMSPRNMLTTTVGDELKLATNFKSKVIGIAIKDRGAILPAGHAANAAYWYDSKTGSFITSNYYMNQLPQWVQDFNNKKMVDSLYKLNWDVYLPKNVYTQYSTADDEPYENKPFGKEQLTFPYNLSKFAGTDYSKIASTPYGNNLTVAMAEAAVTSEQLGKTVATDFLAVSFSSPDYIGHAFGPNSWEELDNYARLDEVLSKFFSFLDAYVGKGAYTVFLTADHGVAHIPNFSKEHKLPGGIFDDKIIKDELNKQLKTAFGKDSIIIGIENYQVVLNHDLLLQAALDKQKITETIIQYLEKQPQFAQVFALDNLMQTPLTGKQKEMFANGYFANRSGDIQIVLKPGYLEGSGNGTSHGLWNPYDSHIPLLWYGWGVKHGKTNRETYMTDIAATLSAMLHIQMPSGCVGKVIEEVLK